MNIAITIIPIFIVIGLGWIARRKGFLPDSFIEPANRLVFYLAIPAMIFREVSKASLQTQFNLQTVLATLIVPTVGFGAGLILCRLMRMPERRRGTFLQSSLHGNLGYIGLAVAFYYLGGEGLARSGIIAGFLMILQNCISVFSLQLYAPRQSGKGRRAAFLKKIFANPVILSACLGICASLYGIQIPIVLDRTLTIVSQMALPTALIIIGGSLSIQGVRTVIAPVIIAGLFKLMLLPALGFGLYRWLGLSPEVFLPGLILLASPSATITVVMAVEMEGDEILAVAAISFSTLLSMLTFVFWLSVSG